MIIIWGEEWSFLYPLPKTLLHLILLHASSKKGERANTTKTGPEQQPPPQTEKTRTRTQPTATKPTNSPTNDDDARERKKKGAGAGR